MRRCAAPVLIVVLMVAACSGRPDAGPTTPAPTGTVTSAGTGPYESVGCEPAPAEQRGSLSSVPLALLPYPVTTGASVRLQIGATEADPTMVGWGADWQCWDGDSWEGTHQLGFGLEAGGRVVPVTPGATTTVPAIGYRVPQRDAFFITIPDVPPGWYRLHVPPLGYLAVEVVAG